MKIVFFGTSNVALPILESLHKHHEIAAVVTQPDAKVGRSQDLAESPVSVLAREMELKTLKPQEIKANNEFFGQLQSFQAEVFIVVSFGRILPMEIISLPKHGTINVHFSLLPKYRGASPIQAALLNGDAQTGTSVFLLDEKLDHGPILAQDAIVIDPDDNFITLGDKLARLSAKLLLNTLYEYATRKITPQPQDDSQASVTKTITRELGKIDWHKTAQEIYNQFRAFYPWPGIWTTWKGKTLKIIDCRPTGTEPNQPAGTVLTGGQVACGQNTVLHISSLQLEGKTQTGTPDFLNGYKDFVDSKLG